MPPVINLGRQINFISGINGVSAGGQAIINLPTNQRYHRNILECFAVNYTGGTAQATTALTGSGTGATVTATIVNGVITAAVIVAGGSGYVVGDTITPTDATGTGAILRVATVSSGAAATLTVTNGGTASPISPTTMLTSVRQLVNGVNIRDITPDSISRISKATGYVPSLGKLPLYYTEPKRNVIARNDINSWDLFGQGTFSIQVGISASVVSPVLTGSMEFDFQRNTRPDGNGGVVPFLQPVSQHQFSFVIGAGRTDINTLPFNFPISRLYILGSSPGNITELDIYGDGNKVLEATPAELQEMYGEYGFIFGTGTNTTTPNGTFSGSPFDVAFISDPDQRPEKALKCLSNFIVRITSSVAQTVTIIMETLPGQYSN